MAVIDICQNVASQVGLDIPTAVLSSSDREHRELHVLLNEMARRLSLEYDWQSLTNIAEHTGDGVTEDFSFPSDYLRMVESARLWSDNYRAYPFEHVTDPDIWLGIKTQLQSPVCYLWIIYQNMIHIRPALPVGAKAKYFYITKNYAKSYSGVPKSQFTDDLDISVIPERLLQLGLIWQWRSNKRMDYAEDMRNYEEAKQYYIGNDRGGGREIVMRSRRKSSYHLPYAYPYPVGQ